jgi:hypothetical protein
LAGDVILTPCATKDVAAVVVAAPLVVVFDDDDCDG